MSATLIIRHKVRDYSAWRSVYDEVEPLRVEHGYTGQRVWQHADDATMVLVSHDFPTVEQASSFANEPALKSVMERAGVDGAPQIEIFTSA
jgi:hypothetical protein